MIVVINITLNNFHVALQTFRFSGVRSIASNPEIIGISLISLLGFSPLELLDLVAYYNQKKPLILQIWA